LRLIRSKTPELLVWLAALLGGLAAVPRPACADVTIESLSIGFGAESELGTYKVAKWAPARVLIRADEAGFDGIMELVTSDADDVPAAVVRRVHIGPNETRVVPTYMKPGKVVPNVTVRLIGPDGRMRSQRTFSASGGEITDPADLSEFLFVAVGNPGGLDPRRIGTRPGYQADRFHIVRLPNARTLPRRWFEYDAVDYLIVTVSDPVVLETFDAAAQAAIKRWVEYGGHLVVTVGSAWTAVQGSFLADLLPAEFDGVEEVQELPLLEAYVGSRWPIKIEQPLVVPKLVNIRGRVLVGSESLPLAVSGTYGFGLVTLIALEADRQPFLRWEGNTDFWLKVLGVEKERGEDEDRAGMWARYALNDLSSHLRNLLEQFEDVRMVPFGWVAFFIFVYIALIGPVDYLFVRYVLKRMEFTWITFPTIVVCVSLAGYYSALWMKGSELRLNRVELIDIDAKGQRLRGTSWFTLFSPKRGVYGVEVRGAGPFYAGEVDKLHGGPGRNISWLGLAEDAIGGTGRSGGMTVFRRGYWFVDDASRLEAVPIPIWSMKDFVARWHGRAVVPLESKLQAIGTDRLKGTVVNRSAVPLRDVAVVFGRRVYRLGELKPNVPVRVETVSPEDLYGFLRRVAGNVRRVPSYRRRTELTATVIEGELDKVIYGMMFYSKMQRAVDYPSNNYFRDLDLSRHLDHRLAIAVAKVSEAQSKLLLNGEEPQGKLSEHRYVRLVLPVKPGGKEPEYVPPPNLPPFLR